MKKLLSFLSLIICLFSFACSPSLSTTQTFTSTSTNIPSKTPTITPIPTATASPTPVRLANQEITTDNINSLEYIRTIGVGTPVDMRYSQDGKIIYLYTTNNTCSYDSQTLETLRCFDYSSDYDNTQVSADGNYLTTISSATSIAKIYNVFTGDIILSIQLRKDMHVSAVSFSPNGEIVAFTGYIIFEDNSSAFISYIFDLSGGSLLKELEDVDIVCFSPDNISFAMHLYKKTEMSIINLDDWSVQSTLVVENIPYDVLFSTDGVYLMVASASWDSKYSLTAFRVPDGKTVWIFDAGSGGFIQNIKFSDNGNYFYFNFGYEKIVIIDVSNWNIVFNYSRILRNRTDITRPPYLTPFGSSDLSIYIRWSYGQQYHDLSINNLELSSDGNYLALYPQMGSLFEVSNYHLIEKLEIQLIAFSPDGERSAEFNFSGDLVLRDISTNTVINSRVITTGLHAAVSPDSQYLATNQLGIVQIWSLADGQLVNTFGSRDGYWESEVAIARNSNTLAVGTSKGDVLLFDILSGELINTITVGTLSKNRLAFSNEGDLLAIVGQTTGKETCDGFWKNAEIFLWNLKSNQAIDLELPEPWKCDIDELSNLKFSPDGENLWVTFMTDQGRGILTRIFNIEGCLNMPRSTNCGKESGIFLNVGIGNIELSPDGKNVADREYTIEDKIIIINVSVTNLETGEKILISNKNSKNHNNLYQFAFSPDSKLLAVLNEEYPKSRMNIWNISDQVLINSFPIEIDIYTPNTVTFSPDGTMLFVSAGVLGQGISVYGIK